MAQIDPEILEKVHRIIAKLQDVNIRVEMAYIFGSFVHGTADQWSDVDIALVSPDFSHDRFEERLRLMKIAGKIDNRIEPVPYRPDDFLDLDPLVWEIKRTGIAISLKTTT